MYVSKTLLGEAVALVLEVRKKLSKFFHLQVMKEFVSVQVLVKVKMTGH